MSMRKIILSAVITVAVGVSGIKIVDSIFPYREDSTQKSVTVSLPPVVPSTSIPSPVVPYHTVYATREGLVGKKTASGLVICSDSLFVALPSRSALGRTVEVIYSGKSVICTVEDVGPHSINDVYWQKNTRPLSESGKRVPEKWGKAKNKAGIDLSDGLWDALGIPRSAGIVKVSWKFSE